MPADLKDLRDRRMASMPLKDGQLCVSWHGTVEPDDFVRLQKMLELCKEAIVTFPPEKPDA